MEEQELIEKAREAGLIGVEPPKGIELKSYKRQLKQALLSLPSAKRQNNQSMFEYVRRAVFSNQPSWQMFLAGAGSTLLVVGCSVGVSSITEKPAVSSHPFSSQPSPYWVHLDADKFNEYFSFIGFNTSTSLTFVGAYPSNGAIFTIFPEATPISLSVKAKKPVELRIDCRNFEASSIQEITISGSMGSGDHFVLYSGSMPVAGSSITTILNRSIDTGSTVIDTGFIPEAGAYALEFYVGDSCVATLPFWILNQAVIAYEFTTP